MFSCIGRWISHRFGITYGTELERFVMSKNPVDAADVERAIKDYNRIVF